MTLHVQAAGRANFVARATGLLLQPSQEWRRIDRGPADMGGLFVYAAVLAAIGPLAALIGGQLFPITLFGAPLRTPLVGAVIAAAAGYVMALGGVYVLGLVIDALAPSFGGVRDRVRAMQVAVYGSTASWLAGVFGLFPALAILGVVGLYSLFLLYRGLPVLMRAPADKALGYTAVVILAAIAVAIAIGMVVAAVTSAFTVGAMGAAGVPGFGL